MSILKKIAFMCKRRLFILASLAFFLWLFMATNAYAVDKIALKSIIISFFENYHLKLDLSSYFKRQKINYNESMPVG